MCLRGRERGERETERETERQREREIMIIFSNIGIVISIVVIASTLLVESEVITYVRYVMCVYKYMRV